MTNRTTRRTYVRRRVRFAHSARFLSARNKFKGICKKSGSQKVKLYSIFLKIIPLLLRTKRTSWSTYVRRRVRFVRSESFFPIPDKKKSLEHKRQSQNFVTAFLRFGLLIIRLFQPQHPTALCSFQLPVKRPQLRNRSPARVRVRHKARVS